MVIEGFSLRDKGPQSGLTWINFANIIVHAPKNSMEYFRAMKQKARFVQTVIETELKQGTRHFNKSGKQLKTLKEILHWYGQDGGYYVEMKGNVRKLLDDLAKKYGMDTKGHESEQDGTSPDNGDQSKPA